MSKSVFKRLKVQMTDEEFSEFIFENVSPTIIIEVLKKMLISKQVVPTSKDGRLGLQASGDK